MNYLLLDSGEGKKLEQVGKYRVIRPAPVAIWKPFLSPSKWEADLVFLREEDRNEWIYNQPVDSFWLVEIDGIKYKVKPTSFGHLGLFFEHSQICDLVQKKIRSRENCNLLNLFAYTGAVTLAAAKAGAKVCHLDASKKVVDWARENLELNSPQNGSVRWIVDDVMKFLKREIKRNHRYDAIVLDPPTFGRGSSGQVFKIEEELFDLLDLCKQLLSDDPLFLILSCHTPGFTTVVLENILTQLFKGKIEGKELFLSSSSHQLPSGVFVLWEPLC